MIGFERKNAVLHGDGVSLVEAAERYGTPLYLYSRGLLEANLDAYAKAFAPVPHRVCYALKANASGGLLRILAARGAGADVVSGGELKAALRAGFPAAAVVFSGVGKTDAELVEGIDAGIGCFNAESEEELRRLAALASARGRSVRVSLRVNPDVDPRSHPYISTGLKQNKFGVEIERAEEILMRARALTSLRIVGVQCHIGSQITDLGPLEEAARGVAALSRRLLAAGLPLEELDIGGGLGVDHEGRGGPTPAELAARVLPQIAGLDLRLVLEPGRSLVASAGVLLTRVIAIKERAGKAFVIVDAGMNDLLRPALYDAYHRIEPVIARDGPPSVVDVVGPVCESGDFLARGRELPRVEPGDLLAVREAGAYAFSMSSNYNLRPRAAEVLVEAGALRLIRRRESFEDLVRTEVE
jgi:diaminopimelate decarboxylase